MPVHWEIDSRTRLITVVAEGEVTRAEADSFLDVLETGDLVSDRKLFDGMQGTTSMTAEDFMAIGVRIRAGHHGKTVGALAVALTGENARLLSRVLGIMASAKRPMRLFDNVEEARRWIGRQAP